MYPLISIENLTKTFDQKTVLDNISYTLHEGEILGIIGRSGAGKTVLLHLMRGIDEPPTSGRIVYHVSLCPSCEHVAPPSMAEKECSQCGEILKHVDIDLWDPENEALKRRIMRYNSIMFQRSFGLYGDDRVIDNVLFALDERNYPASQKVSRAIDLIDDVNLSHRMMHIARDLSGGEKQRVVLARQLAREPICLFADEPTGTLDPRTASMVHEMLARATTEKDMTLVVSSHFPAILQDIVQKAILIENGVIAVEGDPKSVIDAFMKGFSDEEVFEQPELGNIIVETQDLLKQYVSVDRGLIKAVNQVTFTIQSREIFGIIGTSGAGKTTLSRMIAGEIEPTGGKLYVTIGDDQVDMALPGFDNRGRATQYIALLHQEYDLFPHRTVLDNLTDSIGIDLPKEIAKRKVLITLKMAGFDDKKGKEILNRYPDTLSEGEKHRVALAQVLIREPLIVVLDEPTGTMDPITKVDVKHSILHAREEMEETFIVVSHDMEFVREVCDRAALMRFGKIVKIGPTAEVLDEISEEERQRMENE